MKFVRGSGPNIAIVGSGSGGGSPPSIGGVAIGTAGSGAYSGYTMVGGDDFAASIASQVIRPGNPFGTIAHNFSERDRRLTSSTSVFGLGDPYWTGWQDANDGVAISSFSDILTQSGSVLSLKVRQATTGEKLLQGVRDNTATAITYVTSGDASGTTSKRPMVGACFTMPTLSWTGATILEFRWRYTGGPTISGSGNPGLSLWTLSVRGGSEVGDNAGALGYNPESDIWEMSVGTGNTTVRYGSGLTSNGNSTQVYTGGLYHRTRVTITATTYKVESLSDDGLTVIGSATMTNSATNLAELWYFMLGNFAVTVSLFGGSAHFDENQWVGLSSVCEIDWVQVWSAGTTLLPLIPNETLTMVYGGSSSLVLASQATLWGTAVDAEYISPMYAYDTNGPGRASDQTAPLQTRDTLPTGVTWNSGTRTLSFSPSFTTQAGFVNLYVYPSKSGVGFCRPHIITVIVKPKMFIPPPTAATPGAAWTWTVPRGSPRNWDNGNLPLGTGDGLSLISMPAWVSYNSSTKVFSGTAPNPLTDNQIVMRCTNGAGNTTDQTLTIADAGAWAPSSLTGLLYAWDTTDTTNTPDDGSGKVNKMYHIFDNTKYLARTNSANRPTIITNGGANGTSRAVAFASASSQMLDSAEGAGLTALAQIFNAANIQTSSGYLCFATKANSAAVTNRILYIVESTMSMTFGYRMTATSRGIGYSASGQSTVAVADASPDTSWHVVEVIKSTSTFTVTIDGTQIATGTISQTQAMTATEFILGGFYSVGVRTAAFDGAVGPGIAASVIPSTGDKLSSRQWVAAKMGITVV